MDDQSRLSFPQEIWWLIAQELSSRRDFGGLFLCARLSKGIARLALPELYAIHDQSPAINAHILDMETSICLWRSIIASSLGKTLFPYCCWIRALKLGNLHSQLEDLARDNPILKAQFFSSPLEKLQIRSGRGRALNLDAIIVEVASLVTDCIRTSADKEDKRMGITTLEGYYLPTANLPTWLSGLSSLTTLVARDGSVLNSDVARAIRQHCPAFREVECFFCRGTDIDEQIAGFFKNLEPNSLESFTVLSMNELQRKTFKALCNHSRSLKSLALLSLERPALESLNELQHCVSLESLKLEGDWSAQVYDWQTESKQSFQEVVQWLKDCASLKELDFRVIPASTTILADVLKSPTVRLLSLSLKTLDFDDEFCAALQNQSQLQELSIRFDEELIELSEERRTPLADSIACCHELRELDTNELFTFDNTNHMCSSLPLLERIVMYGDLIDDVFLGPIAKLSKLKSLNVYGSSIISPHVLMDFLDQLEADPDGEHEGLQVYIANQNYDFRFTDDEEAWLGTEFHNRFKGRFDINNQMDPDELHESDFSD
ncbi:hypothetical protein N657DRAFT_573148 [Parathielavia appendiculata]|uniref:F-box domain-containing protein n=1 Tax=Parathielavia appendiculata TaxID=2587402 RepID=A0AAN6U078_9PEZI|nr:hypothetical protein N657DRAFT_573148 [Parathielavia appendiculata]